MQVYLQNGANLGIDRTQEEFQLWGAVYLYKWKKLLHCHTSLLLGCMIQHVGIQSLIVGQALAHLYGYGFTFAGIYSHKLLDENGSDVAKLQHCTFLIHTQNAHESNVKEATYCNDKYKSHAFLCGVTISHSIGMIKQQILYTIKL